jgi:hypothetical protein
MPDNKLTGSAGEHFVCFRLATRGWAASLTRDGLARTDILAAEAQGGGMVAIQVKTASGNASWPVGKKGTLPAVNDREWYAFVQLATDGGPKTWLVPRDHIAAVTWVGWHSWRYDPAHEGKRNTGLEGARLAPSDFDAYLERWDLLGTPTSEVPVLLLDWVRDGTAEWGLPEGHPGLT